MFSALKSKLTTDNLKAKTLRGTFATIGLAGGGQVLRFVSNLVLTRILFPEAFGLMALVQVILAGVTMVSTFGLRAAVIQNERADEAAFLNTAWSLQIIRGALLWGAVCLAAQPFAALYSQPMLAQILPVAGLNLLIQGLYPTRVLTAQRHLQLGRYSALTLIAQVVQLFAIAILAYILNSVWALVIGLIIHPVVALILYDRYLSGPRNRFAFERESATQILSLGKFLFISSIATYAITQSDRMFLGLAIPVDLLGIYGIGFALAVLPITLAKMIANSVVFPLYRLKHPLDGPGNQVRIFKARRMVAASALAMTCILALIAPPVVELLYDDRYILAGPIAVLLCAANVGNIVVNGGMHAALSKGDSYRFMMMNVATGIAQVVLTYGFVWSYGIVGVAIAIGAAPLLTYPLFAVYLKRYANWDRVGDTVLMLAGFIMTSLAVLLYWSDIQQLL